MPGLLACQRLVSRSGQASVCSAAPIWGACTSSSSPSHSNSLRAQSCRQTQARCRVSALRTSALPRTQHRKHHRKTLGTYPVPETEKERSSVDYPQEWITPQPSRRPDTQPEFEKLETPLPKKMPGDPEQPDEEEAEEEEKKKKKEEDPDKEGEKEGEPDKEKSPLPDKE